MAFMCDAAECWCLFPAAEGLDRVPPASRLMHCLGASGKQSLLAWARLGHGAQFLAGFP